MTNQKVFTLGCKVNQVESSEIEKILLGYDSKNILVVNTCTLTEKADAKCRNLITRLAKTNPDKTLIVTGCLVESNNASIRILKKQLPNIIFITNKQKNKIPEILKLKLKNSRHKISIKTTEKTRVFLKIQDGCDHFCSYCIVPYVRSQKWSMPIHEIDSAVQKAISDGFQEIVLAGIRIGFYEYTDELGQRWNFAKTLQKIARTKRLKRLRISSIEPTEITDEIIDIIGENKIICPHLHIAFQSGDDEILRSMRRGYDTNYLKNLVEKLRRKITDLRITIDLIIGYPGETDENFGNTLKLLKDLEIDGIHIFTFSPRKGTKAYSMQNKIPSNIIAKRKQIMKNFDLDARVKSLKKFQGKEMKILIESGVKNGLISGYTPNYIRVFIPVSKISKNSESLVTVKLEKIQNIWPVFFVDK